MKDLKSLGPVAGEIHNWILGAQAPISCVLVAPKNMLLCSTCSSVFSGFKIYLSF